MRVLAIAAIAAVFAASAHADMIFKGDGVTVRLMESPWPAKVAALIQPQYVPRFMAAEVNFQGRPLQACWTLNAGNVVIIDEDSEAGEIPAVAFEPAKGV